MKSTIKNFCRGVGIFATILIVLGQQAIVAAAPTVACDPTSFNCITQNDVSCAIAGDLGGTCAYDPNACPTGSSSPANAPAPATNTAGGGITVDDSAGQQAAQKASTGGTQVGYALYDSTGKLLSHSNDTFENYGASITKSMLLVAYLKQIGSGTLSSEAKSQLTDLIENSANGSASSPGPAYWVYSHLNNGLNDVKAVASDAGMTGFKPDTSDPLYVLGQSQITANDFAKFFSKIDTLMPASQKSFGLDLLSHLAAADQNGLLQAGLPGTVYAKEGWKSESSGSEGAPYIVNQAAQFASGGTTYGVAVTVGGTTNQASGEAIVKSVVSALINESGGASSPAPASGSSGSSGCCSASGSSDTNATTTPSPSTSTQPVIVIDPGHSGHDITDNDPQTGLYDHDYPNIPEISEVFSVAQKVQTKLQADGYKVVMTKSSVDQDVSFRQRADIADQANADLALSIHDSHGTSWSDMGGGDGGQVYTQNVGDYRQNTPGIGSGNQKITFTDSTIAQKSNQYGKIFAQQRAADEGHKVEVVHDSFDGRPGIAAGNIPMVQLFAKVPWVYNEVGAPSGALSQTDLDKYAKGIIDGVEKSIPVTGSPASTSPTTSTPTSGGCCSGAVADTGSSATDAGTSGGSWNSGLKPPYIIEQYAINVLEDLAQKKGKPVSDAVTKQHVLALVAWAYIEGGDINNDSIFNLWNTSWSTGVGIASTGLPFPAYSSFDDGVEASTRTLAQKGDYPLADALLDPNSTAEQVGHAESYMGVGNTYPGSNVWVGSIDPATYYKTNWVPLISQVKSDYKKYASLVIGTSAKELLSNTSNPGALSNINSGGFSSGSTSSDCSSASGTGQGAQAIVQEALKLAWADGSHGNTPKPEYAAALQQYNPGNYTGDIGNDCGVFVSTVVRASGVDTNYPPSGTGSQWSYVVSHPKLYSVQYNVTSLSQLQPGDILIVGGPGGAGAAGHTWIYVGTQPGPKHYYSASASEGSRTGNLDTDQLTDSAASGGYMRVRVLQ